MNVACLEKFTSDFVVRLMPEANKTYIKRYWPIVYMALDEYGLDYEEKALMTLATIAAETGNFNITVREFMSATIRPWSVGKAGTISTSTMTGRT